MSFSSIVTRAFSVFALSIFFTLLSQIGLAPIGWASGQKKSETKPQETSIFRCAETLQGQLVNTAFSKDGTPYVVFRDFDHALKSLEDGHKATKKNLRQRIRLLIPAMNGVRELILSNGSHFYLDSKKKMYLRGAINMWLSTLKQVKDLGKIFDEKNHEKLYQVLIRMTGTDLYSDFEHPHRSSDFANVYSKLDRSPPKKQLEKWLRAYDKAVASARYKNLSEILELLPLFDPRDIGRGSITRSELIKIWLKREVEIRAEVGDLPLTVLGHNLNRLYQVEPKAALKYFKRHKEDFLMLNENSPEFLVRPLLYFKYVFGEDVPDFNQYYLTKFFSNVDTQKTSSIENKVADWLVDYDVNFEQNTFDRAASSIEMDLYVVLDDGRRINIEVDGPHHFMIDEEGNYILNEEGRRERRLADLRRDETLKAMGIEVYRIPYNGFDANEVKATEEKLMEYLIDGK